MITKDEWLPEWMKLLEDNMNDEIHRELRASSKLFQEFERKEEELLQAYPILGQIIERAQFNDSHHFTPEEMQALSDVFYLEEAKQIMVKRRLYWKSWIDCIRVLRYAGLLKEQKEVEYYGS